MGEMGLSLSRHNLKHVSCCCPELLGLMTTREAGVDLFFVVKIRLFTFMDLYDLLHFIQLLRTIRKVFTNDSIQVNSRMRVHSGQKIDINVSKHPVNM